MSNNVNSASNSASVSGVITPSESHNRPDATTTKAAVITPNESHNRPDVATTSTAVVTPNESHNRPDAATTSTAVVTPDESHNRPDVVSALGGSGSTIQFIYNTAGSASAATALPVAGTSTQTAGSTASALLGSGSVSVLSGAADHWLQTVVSAAAPTTHVPTASASGFIATLAAGQTANLVAGTTGPDHAAAVASHS